jgi:hypothetical protein
MTPLNLTWHETCAGFIGFYLGEMVSDTVVDLAVTCPSTVRSFTGSVQPPCLAPQYRLLPSQRIPPEQPNLVRDSP